MTDTEATTVLAVCCARVTEKNTVSNQAKGSTQTRCDICGHPVWLTPALAGNGARKRWCWDCISSMDGPK